MSGKPYQDFVVLGGLTSPGKAVVRGGGSPRTWDIQQGYGLSGATIVFTGAGLAKFEIDIYAWEDAHFLAWPLFARPTLALPPPVRIATSLSIQHPELNDFPVSITQCVVEDVTKWEKDPDDSMWMRTIKCIAFRAPKPILQKAYQGPPGDPTKVATPVDPEQQIIANKNAIIQGLLNP